MVEGRANFLQDNLAYYSNEDLKYGQITSSVYLSVYYNYSYKCYTELYIFKREWTRQVILYFFFKFQLLLNFSVSLYHILDHFSIYCQLLFIFPVALSTLETISLITVLQKYLSLQISHYKNVYKLNLWCLDISELMLTFALTPFRC